MRKLLIEWKHYTKDGNTCKRCSNTGNNLLEILKDLKKEYAAQGIEIKLKEIELPESQMSESNMIIVNGVPLEDLLPNAKVEENNCCSCGELTGKQTNCRTLSYQEKIYEAISSELIRLAIQNSL